MAGAGSTSSCARSPVRADPLFKEVGVFCFHVLDLHPDLDDLFRGFYKSCVQRKIRGAARENLQYMEGRPDQLLGDFYRLLVRTQRRHHRPPPPLLWFQNLIECFGDKLSIRVAFKERDPVAGILTLRHKHTMTYKYGCSDMRFNNTGAIHGLFWAAIQAAKSMGVSRFDLGRTHRGNLGLIAFKSRWGAERSEMRYFRHPPGSKSLGDGPMASWITRKVVAVAPDALLTATGSALYRHFG